MLVRRGMGRGGRPGLLGTAARTAVVAGTATAVAGGVSRHQQSKEDQTAQAEASQREHAAAVAAAAAAAPEVAAPAGDTDHRIAQIKQLAELHDRGVLTDDEFAAEKAKLLA